MAQILILDDELPLLQSLKIELSRSGHECLLAETGREAFKILDKDSPDLAILDVQLPDISGLEVLQRLRQEFPHVPVLIVTAYASVDTAVEAMKEGATDYLEKPLDLEELHLVVERELKNARLRDEVAVRRRGSQLLRSDSRMIGECQQLEEIRHLVGQLSQVPFDNAADLPTILIDGETGVGKDLLANYIHYSSPLSDQPFIQVNCSGLPRELIESELFGHEKGSFTGATQQKQGLFEVASSGTIFLDEVGDMPLDMQTKLLHVLENKRVRRVGGTREHDVNVRIIAATNQNLEGAIAANKFRSDLFYRLKVVHINLPPLRDRGRDRALLIEYFLERYMRKYRRPELKITKEVLNELLRYNWPGNVREMAHTIERLVLISEGNDLISPKFSSASGSDGGADRGPLSAVDLEFDFQTGDCSLQAVEKRLIERALAHAHGNVSEVARILGLTRGALRHRMEKWGIDS
ncbi:MAG TPA: sigma-54-dependent Fis family transcriptional regulator [Planctomycetes bacterium]|nr:sigma-54-dependent Fis family transcriptional regulator [Planctomycetota bacterium]HIN80762.1 sigma-54-dependent Fis family transcriptional regulator [Planctomycetota bacterium]